MVYLKRWKYHIKGGEFMWEKDININEVREIRSTHAGLFRRGRDCENLGYLQRFKSPGDQ